MEVRVGAPYQQFHKHVWEGAEFRFDDVAAYVKSEELLDVPNTLSTQRQFGPVPGITWFAKRM